MPINLRALLEEMIEKDASDLHLVAGERPKLRVDGDIVSATSEDVMTGAAAMLSVSIAAAMTSMSATSIRTATRLRA